MMTRDGYCPFAFLNASRAPAMPTQRLFEASWPTSSCTTLVDQYVVAVLFIEADNAMTDLLPSFASWNTSRPQIMVGLSMKGSLSTAQGMPPSLAFIWMRTLETIERMFLPREMVLQSTTCDGMGYSARRNLLTSSYSGFLPFWPGRMRTTIWMPSLSCFFSSRIHASAFMPGLTEYMAGSSASKPTWSRNCFMVALNWLAVWASRSPWKMPQLFMAG